MIDWDDGLRISGTDLYLDARRPRPLCFVSHAHADHIARHTVTLATPVTLALAERRIGLEQSISLPFNTDHQLGQTQLSLHPAGHVLGSAMIRVKTGDGTLLYTGDFKLRESLTVPAAEPVEADWLVMESTYGRPMFRFPPWRESADRLIALVADAFKSGRQPIVMGYSLGKAQELVRLLTDAGFMVTEHGAVANMSALYEAHGVPLGNRRRYVAKDFHGVNALSLEERGVLVAPPQVARSAFSASFENKLTIMVSGWGLLSGVQYRYGVDHVIPISDHADFDELIELVERVRPKQILTLHGYPDFADTLCKMGHNARLAKPDPQMSLFG